MRQVPVTVLTGFLGSGKTTLLNRILTEQHGKKYAVIINEFDELGIDDQLVVSADEEVFEMNNGCICCTVRGDLIRILSNLSKRADRLDGVLVETTGLADPAPVAQTFFVDEDVRARHRLDAIVTLVDAKHVLEHLDDQDEAVEQIGFADVILLNKVDLVSPEEADAVEARIRAINRFAPIHRTTNSAVDLGVLLNKGAFDLDRIVRDDPHFLDTGHHHHDHSDGVTSVSFSIDRPIDPQKFESWIAMVLRLHGQDIFRSKGILNVRGASQRFVFQGVHMQIETRWGTPWRPRDARDSRIVFIGRDLNGDWLRDGFMNTLA
ncbi:MAG: GTP-binding protein [Alphaproteobacteria bacterium]|nr:GTP-binding protein [Alphaproteobacteria bacterium]TAD87780.1 MAG: GTP-binding protein [Alphaproteobacteria bacterium]